MKILVAADMEGISGVVHFDQVTPGHPEYERSRKVMTADVNAAVKGAFHGGADEVIVTDGHWEGRNLLLEELDSRVSLNVGLSSPWSMLEGIDKGVNGVLFIGYHARMGSLNAILDHTWSSARVANVWLNGKLTGEIGLNAAVCGHFNVPVLMISGDQTACAEAAELLGHIEQAVVKKATGRNSAECLPLEASQEKIRNAAHLAVNHLQMEAGEAPYRVQAPPQMVIEFLYSDMADRAAQLPGISRLEGKRIGFKAPDMTVAYQLFRSVVNLAAR